MGKGRVLVVDDEVELLELVKMRLAACGYDVEVASGGEEALEKTRAFDPEVILLDLMMPGVNGFEVCRAVKQNPAVYGTPIIIALTALADEENILRAMSDGANSYIVKPFETKDLLGTIDHYLEEKRNREKGKRGAA